MMSVVLNRKPGEVTDIKLQGIKMSGVLSTGTVVVIGGGSGAGLIYDKLALFVGGNYLKSNLTVTGQVGLDDLLTIGYVIDQENKDKWNVVIGGNWDINRNWSIAMEYNGFTGSREAYIASLTWRF